MASIQSIQRRPLSTEATRLLKDMIVGGDLEPGERLYEVDLAQRLGTSRTPVREAMVRLEHEGILQKRPQGGYKVRPISAKEVAEAVGLRAVLESYAVELAVANMQPKLLAKLEKNVEMFAAALARGDSRRLVELNTRFHTMLYDAADSEMLSEFIGRLSDLLHRFRRALLGDAGAADHSLADHQELLAALKKGDPAEAAEICRIHVERGGRWMMERIEKQELEL